LCKRAKIDMHWCGGRELNPRRLHDWTLNPRSAWWFCICAQQLGFAF
jgi:hypothetical protein